MKIYTQNDDLSKERIERELFLSSSVGFLLPLSKAKALDRVIVNNEKLNLAQSKLSRVLAVLFFILSSLRLSLLHQGLGPIFIVYIANRNILKIHRQKVNENEGLFTFSLISSKHN